MAAQVRITPLQEVVEAAQVSRVATAHPMAPGETIKTIGTGIEVTTIRTR